MFVASAAHLAKERVHPMVDLDMQSLALAWQMLEKQAEVETKLKAAQDEEKALTAQVCAGRQSRSYAVCLNGVALLLVLSFLFVFLFKRSRSCKRKKQSPNPKSKMGEPS